MVLSNGGSIGVAEGDGVAVGKIADKVVDSGSSSWLLFESLSDDKYLNPIKTVPRNIIRADNW
jgi:hypothetical protein